MSNLNLIPIGTLFDLDKGSLQSSKCTEGEYTFITAAEEWKTHNEYSHECEALIFAAAASGSLGRTHYINDKFITSDLCFILTPKDSKKYPINLKFYHFVFNSLKDEIVKNTKSGTSKESINQSNLRNYEIPYFEIDKQNLWIDKLVNTKSIKEDLEFETTTQQSLLKQLKQTILQEAIEGKLTAKYRAKNPDIGTAQELLEQIKTEKEKLIKEKKIKASKPLSPINEDEIPFYRSEDTIFVRLIDLFNIEKGQIGISKAIEGEYPLVVTAQERLSHNEYQVDGEAIIIPLVSSTGHGHASMNRIHYESGKFAVGSILSVLTPIHKDLISAKFYYEYLLQNKDELLVKKMTGAANVTLTLSALCEVVVPYISINIQKKIEEIFNICDKLEDEINQNKTTVDNLMATVLKEAFEE